jgi:adenosine deaminase
LNDEYQHAVEDCGLTIDQLIQTALNAVRVSYLPERDRTALFNSFQSEYERLRLSAGI